MSVQEPDQLIEKIRSARQRIRQPSPEPTGAEGVQELPPEDIDPELFQRQLIGNYFNMEGLPLTTKLARYAEATKGIVDILTLKENPFSIPQQAMFRLTRGDSPLDVAKYAMRSVTFPTARRMIQTAPGTLLETVTGLEGPMSLSGEEKMELAKRALFEEEAVTAKEALHESTLPLDHPVVSAIMGPTVILRRERLREDWGIENPTLGDLVRHEDQVFRKAMLDVGEDFDKYVPEIIQQLSIPLIPGRSVTFGEFMSDRPLDAMYTLMDFMADPMLLDVVLGGPAIQAAGRMVGKAGAALRGVAPAARKIGEAFEAAGDIGVKIGRWYAGSREGVSETEEAAIKEFSRLLEEADTPFTISTLHAPLESKAILPPRHLVDIEQYREQALPRLPSEIRDAQVSESPYRTIEGGFQIEGVPVSAAEWRAHIYGGPEGAIASPTALGRRYAELVPEYQRAQQRVVQISENLASEPNTQVAMERIEKAQRKAEVLSNQLRVLEDANQARAQTEKVQRLARKAKDRQLTELARVEKGLLQRKEIPTISPGEAVAPDAPAGLQLEGAPQGVLTVGPDAPPIRRSQVMAASWNPTTNQRAVDLYGNTRFMVPFRTKEELGEFLRGGSMTDPQIGGGRSTYPYHLHVRINNEILEEILGRAGTESRTLQNTGMEVLGAYEFVEAAEHGDTILRPIAARGGLPANVFPSTGRVTQATERAAARRLEDLRVGEPLHHHNHLDIAISILYDGKLRVAGSPYSSRRVPTISFTRFDVTKAPNRRHAKPTFGGGVSLVPFESGVLYDQVLAPIEHLPKGFTVGWADAVHDFIAVAREEGIGGRIDIPGLGKFSVSDLFHFPSDQPQHFRLTETGAKVFNDPKFLEALFDVDKLSPMGMPYPTSTRQFNSQFGGVRFVTTREELTRRAGKPVPFDFHGTPARKPARKLELKRSDTDFTIDEKIPGKPFVVFENEIVAIDFNNVLKYLDQHGVQSEISPGMWFVSKGDIDELNKILKTARGGVKPSVRPTLSEVEERVFKDVPIDAIKKVEIDPAEIQMRTGAAREATYTMVETLVKGFESMGIPVEIRPLHLQNEIEAYRPFLDARMLGDRLAKGLDTTEQQGKLLTHAATASLIIRPEGDMVPAADVAWNGMRGENQTMPYTYPGKAYDETYAIVPWERRFEDISYWQRYIDDSFPGGPEHPEAKAILRAFYPDPTPIWLNNGAPMPPDLRGLGLEPPYPGPWENRRLLPAFVPGPRHNDLGLWGSWIDEPIDAMSKLDHPNARQILNVSSRARFEKAMFLADMQRTLQPVEDWISRDFKKRDKLVYSWLNVDPDTPEFATMVKNMTGEEQEIFHTVRRAYDNAWDLMVEHGLVEEAGVRYIRNYGPILFPKDGDLALGATPLDLHDLPVNGNVLLSHLKHRFGGGDAPIESFSQTSRIYFSGVGRKVFDEPAWKEMLKLSGNTTVRGPGGKQVPIVRGFPRNGKLYVEEWVKAQKGYPSRLEASYQRWSENVMRRAAEGTATRGERFMRDLLEAHNNVATVISHQFYKGYLTGSLHFWLQNFMTQGVLNPASRYGPFETMQGIARHADSAWRGLEPQEALVSGFNAIFDDLSTSMPGVVGKMAKRFRSTRGARELRGLMKTLENSVGVTAVESQMRGISWEIGFNRAKQLYENRIGRKISIEEAYNSLAGKGPVPKEVVREWMLEGVRTSDNVNFVYGVHGSNPRLRNIVGGKAMGVTFQFMSYYGKEAGYLLRNSFSQVRKDPGLILRYWELLGVMDRMMAQADISGDEFNLAQDVQDIGRRYVEYGEAPVGPYPKLLLGFIRAVTHEDPGEAERSWGEFFDDAAGATNGILAIRRAIEARRQLDAGTRINPYSDETVRPLRDSETLALVLGTQSETDARARRIEREWKRIEKARTQEVEVLAKQWLEAFENGDVEQGELIEQRAQAWGVDFVPGVDRALKRVAISRLLRMIEDTNLNFTNSVYLDQLRNEFPEIFDPEQSRRFQDYWNDIQEKRRQTLQDAGQDMSLEEYRLRQKVRNARRYQQQTEGAPR